MLIQHAHETRMTNLKSYNINHTLISFHRKPESSPNMGVHRNEVSKAPQTQNKAPNIHHTSVPMRLTYHNSQEYLTQALKSQATTYTHHKQKTRNPITLTPTNANRSSSPKQYTPKLEHKYVYCVRTQSRNSSNKLPTYTTLVESHANHYTPNNSCMQQRKTSRRNKPCHQHSYSEHTRIPKFNAKPQPKHVDHTSVRNLTIIPHQTANQETKNPPITIYGTHERKLQTPSLSDTTQSTKLQHDNLLFTVSKAPTHQKTVSNLAAHLNKSLTKVTGHVVQPSNHHYTRNYILNPAHQLLMFHTHTMHITQLYNTPKQKAHNPTKYMLNNNVNAEQGQSMSYNLLQNVKSKAHQPTLHHSIANNAGSCTLYLKDNKLQPAQQIQIYRDSCSHQRSIHNATRQTSTNAELTATHETVPKQNLMNLLSIQYKNQNTTSYTKQSLGNTQQAATNDHRTHKLNPVNNL
eukprot:gene3179-2161_t